MPFTTNFSRAARQPARHRRARADLDFIFLGTSAANGYDALGHFLRAEGVGNACLGYAVTPSTDSGCRRKLFSNAGTTASAGNAPNASAASVGSGTSVLMARTLAVLKGATPAQALAKYPGATTVSAGEALAPSQTSGATTPGAAPVGGSTAGTTYYTPASEGSEADGLLLKYLLGSE